MSNFSKSSLAQLETCHSDLQVLAYAVLELHDCKVVHGRRTKEEQDLLFAQGKSKLQYPDSKHNTDPSDAMDLVPCINGQPTWDREYSAYFAGIVLATAAQLYKQRRMQHKIRWGGNWSTDLNTNFKTVSFYDGTHFELYR